MHPPPPSPPKPRDTSVTVWSVDLLSYLFLSTVLKMLHACKVIISYLGPVSLTFTDSRPLTWQVAILFNTYNLDLVQSPSIEVAVSLCDVKESIERSSSVWSTDSESASEKQRAGFWSLRATPTSIQCVRRYTWSQVIAERATSELAADMLHLLANLARIYRLWWGSSLPSTHHLWARHSSKPSPPRSSSSSFL